MAMISMNGAQGNPLMPGASPSAQPDMNSAFAAMHSQLESTRAQFNKLVNYQGTLKKTQEGLDELVKLGDTISLDDVVKVAGELVSHGLDPATMAGVLADAPQNGGEALAGWIGEQSSKITQRMSQLAPVLAKHQHQMGVEAFQTLALHSALPGQSIAQGPATAMAMAMPRGSAPVPAPGSGPTNALGAGPMSEMES